MASSNLLTIDEVITAAFLALDLQDSRDEFVFREWAWDALRVLGPSRVSKKSECIDVCEFEIPKPCGYISTLNLNLLDKDGRAFAYQFSETGVLNSDARSTPSGISITDGSYSEAGFHYVKVEEQHKCFALSSNAALMGIVSAELSYYAYPFDENGDLMIEEEFKNAIVAYIEFMYTKRHKKRDNKLGLSNVQYFEDRWNRLCASAKANSRMPDPMAARSIGARWMTLIPNFKKNSKDYKTYPRTRF